MDDTTVPQAPIANNREEIAAMLDELRQRGTIDLAEDGVLMRHYETLVDELRDEKQRLQNEYERRCEADGKDQAGTWLAEAAQELGRRHREATMQVIAQCGEFREMPPVPPPV